MGVRPGLKRRGCRWGHAARACPRLIARQAAEIAALNLYAPQPLGPAVSCTHLDAGKGAWPATDAAAGGDRAGSSVGGPLGPTLRLWCRSGVEHRYDVTRGSIAQQAGGRRSRSGIRRVGLTRPSQAARRGSNRAERRGLADNGRAERTGFVETVFYFQTPDGVRRSATLSIHSARDRVRARSHAITTPPPVGKTLESRTATRTADSRGVRHPGRHAPSDSLPPRNPA